MKKIVHLIDSVQYVEGNCFQHQLFTALRTTARDNDVELKTVDLYQLMTGQAGAYDQVVSALKLRTLFRNAESIKGLLQQRPIVVYDQDPWESFRDGSEFNGAYSHIARHLNVKKFAVTTREWAQLIASKGLPSEFVRMWVLPKYCNAEPSYDARKITMGFMGAQHPYRRKLFDFLAEKNHPVTIVSGGSNYATYMSTLSKMQCYVHNEDSSFLVDGNEMNLSHGLWIKDIEAAARGCYSIRNRGADAESYVLDGVKTVRLFVSFDEVPGIIASIESMHPSERQKEIEQTVNFIVEQDHWSATARALLEL